MGRRKLPNDDVTIPVRLPRGLVERIDGHVSDVEYQARELEPDEFVQLWGSGNPKSAIARLRRDFIGRLIERALHVDTLFPLKVTVSAGAGGNPADLQEAIDWMREAENRLTAEAPAPVRLAFGWSRAMRELHERRRADS